MRFDHMHALERFRMAYKRHRLTACRPRATVTTNLNAQVPSDINKLDRNPIHFEFPFTVDKHALAFTFVRIDRQ